MVLEGVCALVSPARFLLNVCAKIENHLFKVFRAFSSFTDVELYMRLIQVMGDRKDVPVRLSTFVEEIVYVLDFSIISIAESGIRSRS